MFEHIVIVGCGLIGSSFALALRRAGFEGRITGWGGGEESLQVALRRDIINDVERSFEENKLCQGDLLFLAAPIGAILDFLKSKSALIRAGALVTDAGSTKAEICRAARSFLPPTVDFIGGHPMAGSEKRGAENARADLFDGATYILTPDEKVSAERLARFELLVRELGAHPVRMDPEEHDRAVALISHLPQYLSTALAALIQEQPDSQRLYELSAGSYRDLTRLAASRFDLWRDISLTNRENICAALELFIQRIVALREALEGGDLNFVKECFEAANEAVRDYNRARQVKPTEG